MIDPIPRWFEITQYNDKKFIMIENLVEAIWMVKYPPWPIEIIYDRGSEFLVKRFKNNSIE